MKNRPERLISFLVVWLTMFSFYYGWGQKPGTLTTKNQFSKLQYAGGNRYMAELNPFLLEPVQPARAVFSPFYLLNPYSAQENGKFKGLYTQPADLYYLQSGFFCKREWEFEKTTKIPFRFRLGSLADCNALEGKH